MERSGTGVITSAAVKIYLIIVSVVVVEIAVASTLVPLTDRGRVASTDFVNFYVGASIVRVGDGARLYQRNTQDAAFKSVLGYASNQYFLHPVFEAALFTPLTRLSLERAFILWTLINVALLGLLPLILMRCIPLVSVRPYLGQLGFCFLPALIAVVLGQDSVLLLFVISSSYLLLRKEKEVAAGLVLSLATIKFQYVLILVPLLLLSRKLRVGAGFALGCALLGIVFSLITGPGGLMGYFEFVRGFESHSGYGGLNPTLMVNVRGFLAGIGETAHSPLFSVAGGIILLGLGVFGSQMARDSSRFRLAFALYLSIALAAAPYAHFPDMTVLLLPLLLALDYIAGMGIKSFSRKLICACCVLMLVWPFLLLVLGGHYWWNSRIYLVFPVIVLFIGALTSELHFSKAASPVSLSPTLT
ncbi:MAG TPA: glycosyltransferase family 87 protein [Terriglobales bacterium]|nr:glycosyltransferase family 87 protein [Terriglobales bacterium]